MTRWQTLAIALVVAGLAAFDCNAQQAAPWLNPPPQPPAQSRDIRYPVTPQAGEWLICVQTFKGDQAQFLAEQMAEMMMRDYKLPAYLHVRGRKERAEEDERIRKLRQQYDEMFTNLQSQNPETQRRPFRVGRFAKIEEEFAVLVCDARGFKTMDAAHDFLPKLRKLPAPPKEFSSRYEFGDLDAAGNKMTPKDNGYLNPFMTAFPAHNPTIPFEKQQANPEIADDFLKKLNANEDLSVLKCSKPYTLVVKVYQGQAVMQAPESPGIMRQFGQAVGLVKKEPEILNAQTAQARATADFLRHMKPSFESYVMHQSTYSIVTVGQYDSPTDPNLVANQRSLAALQIKDAAGTVLEKLSVEPRPMKIPR